jgi:hypothetical protein
MQRAEWTFDGSTEVTVNFFSLHAFHLLIGHAVNQIAWLRDQEKSISKFLTAHQQPTYEEWKGNYGVGLYTFAVLFNHFGWQSVYTFLKEYERDITGKSSSLPNNNQEKLDQWVLRYSKIVNFNIAPHFKRFGLPVSQHVNIKLGYLKQLDIDIRPETFFNYLPNVDVGGNGQESSRNEMSHFFKRIRSSITKRIHFPK